MSISEQTIAEKSRTIKIDIRSLGYGRPGVPGVGKENDCVDYFARVDPSLFFENSYDAIIVADEAGRVLQANARAAQFFGYDKGTLSRASLSLLIAGITEDLLHQIHSEVTKNRRYMRIQAFARHKDGNYSSVEVIVMSNMRVGGADDPICYLIRDTQLRYEAEQNLNSAYHAMDNTDAGIGVATLQGVFSYANRALCELFADAKNGALVGQPLDIWFDRKKILEPMLEKIQNRESWSGEQRFLRGEKSAWLLIYAVPDVNEDGELTGLVLSVRDLAERRRAEIAEQSVARNRALMESLSSVCHDLGQPATVLLTSLELLKQEKDLDAETARQMVDMSYEAALDLRRCLQELNTRRRSGTERPDGDEGEGES